MLETAPFPERGVQLPSPLSRMHRAVLRVEAAAGAPRPPFTERRCTRNAATTGAYAGWRADWPHGAAAGGAARAVASLGATRASERAAQLKTAG